MNGDWCRVDITGDATQATTVLLAAWVDMMRLQLRAEGMWPPPVGEIEYLGFLIVGPDDLPDAVEFQGCSVIRVPHWPGKPCVGVPLVEGNGAQEAYAMCRRLQGLRHGMDQLHLFGPPGTQYLSVGLVEKQPESKQRYRLLRGVPVDRMVRGLMIGVELS